MTTHETVHATAGQVLSLTAIGGAVMGIVPPIAAIVGLIYYLILLYETATVQGWITKRRERKLAKLAAKAIVVQAAIVADTAVKQKTADDAAVSAIVAAATTAAAVTAPPAPVQSPATPAPATPV